MQISMSKLRPGERGIIFCIQAEPKLKRRLIELGFMPGEMVECVGRGFFHSPGAYKIAGGVMAVRDVDGEKVTLKKYNL